MKIRTDRQTNLIHKIFFNFVGKLKKYIYLQLLITEHKMACFRSYEEGHVFGSFETIYVPKYLPS